MKQAGIIIAILLLLGIAIAMWTVGTGSKAVIVEKVPMAEYLKGHSPEAIDQMVDRIIHPSMPGMPPPTDEEIAEIKRQAEELKRTYRATQDTDSE